MKEKEIAQLIDHTLLKPFATYADFSQLCEEAKTYQFKMVAINSYPVKQCAKHLASSNVHVGAAIGFPLGQTTIATKVFEVRDAIANGCDEIDYVMNITELKAGNLAYIEQEMQEIVDVCRNHQILVKVILETCYLTDEEKIAVCKIAKRVKPDFVKTSTGFGSAGATLEDVTLMKKTVGDAVAVKAAGGIRTLDDLLAMVEAGASRIGTSAGIAIIEEYRKRHHE